MSILSSSLLHRLRFLPRHRAVQNPSPRVCSLVVFVRFWLINLPHPARSRSPSSSPGPPVCAVCAEGYTPDIGYACSRCIAGRRAATITVLSVLLLTAVVLTAALGVRHLRSRRDDAQAPIGGGSGAASRGLARIRSRLWHSRVAQTVKIIVVSWQIITQASGATSTNHTFRVGRPT